MRSIIKKTALRFKTSKISQEPVVLFQKLD